MEDKKEIKRTEFDSSVATLERINDLIKQLHTAALNFGEHSNKWGYIHLLDRLFIEGNSKFDNEEIEICIKYQEELQKIINKFPANILNIQRIYKTDHSGTWRINLKYDPAWYEIKNHARVYEIYLIRCLDSHNMLMKDSVTGVSKFRGGK